MYYIKQHINLLLLYLFLISDIHIDIVTFKRKNNFIIKENYVNLNVI